MLKFDSVHARAQKITSTRTGRPGSVCTSTAVSLHSIFDHSLEHNFSPGGNFEAEFARSVDKLVHRRTRCRVARGLERFRLLGAMPPILASYKSRLGASRTTRRTAAAAAAAAHVHVKGVMFTLVALLLLGLPNCDQRLFSDLPSSAYPWLPTKARSIAQPRLQLLLRGGHAGGRHGPNGDVKIEPGASDTEDSAQGEQTHGKAETISADLMAGSDTDAVTVDEYGDVDSCGSEDYEKLLIEFENKVAELSRQSAGPPEGQSPKNSTISPRKTLEELRREFDARFVACFDDMEEGSAKSFAQLDPISVTQSLQQRHSQLSRVSEMDHDPHSAARASAAAAAARPAADATGSSSNSFARVKRSDAGGKAGDEDQEDLGGMPAGKKNMLEHYEKMLRENVAFLKQKEQAEMISGKTRAMTACN